MGLVSFVLSSIGLCTDIVCFLLDLNFIIVHSLTRCVVACVLFVNSLPSLLTRLALGCWDWLVFCLLYLAEGALLGAQGTVTVLEGVLESLKTVCQLSSQAWLRWRELLQRGALSASEGCGTAASLVASLVDGAVNALLVGAQSLYSGVVGVLQAVSSLLQMVLELVLTLLGFIYSSLVGASLFLWSPCIWTLECLFSLAQILTAIFILDVYGLLLTASVSAAAALYLNPEPARQGARRLASVPALRSLLESVRRLRRPVSQIPGALRLLRAALWHLYLQERDHGQRLFRRGSRLGQDLLLGLRLRLGAAVAVRDDRVAGDGDPGRRGGDGAGRRAPPDGSAGVGPSQEQHHHHQWRQPEDRPELAVPGTSSTTRPLQKLSGRGDEGDCDADSLLSLLKEQEERKRCVICQDCTKTVVLLPCRHLCLCKDCTTLLLRQPIYLRNCPLCRHMILTTMDVYL